VLALAAPTTALAVGHSAGTSACAQAKHRFVDAESATVTAGVISVKAHPATFHCGGEDDGHYNVSKTKETLTVKADAVITVFKNPENPSKSITVMASALPHWLKHNKSEPIYRLAGPKDAVTKLTEQFHP
jgi:hypothetical protein